MFKFLKELKESFKEGVDEAKQELAEEEENKSKEVQLILEQIQKLPKEELFGSSLAAPFRATAFNDWFSLFKSTKESLEETVVPMHLFTFGIIDHLDKENIEALKRQQEQSFDVKNEKDVLEIGKSLLLSTGINLTSLSDVDVRDEWIKSITRKNNDQLNAWVLSAFASLLISGVEFNNVSKDKALNIFAELIPYVVSDYDNWNEFSNMFLEQDKILDINKEKQLENTVSYLTYKFGSPWVQYPLETYK